MSRRFRWVAGALLVPVAATAAWAMWTADIAPGSHGEAVAAEVGAGVRPAAAAEGSAVTVTWEPSALSDGTPVTRYVVTRTDATTGVTVPTSPVDPSTGTGSSCTQLVTATTCTETVPDGTWTYTVTPAAGTHWRGPASPSSDPVVVDTTAPTGGSVELLGLGGTGGRYSTSTALSLRLTPGTDPNGLAAGAELRRREGPLTSTGTGDGVCGPFDPALTSLVQADPAAEVTDVVPAGQRCYRYEYVVSDTFGNTATVTSREVAVDTTAPSTPTLAAFAGASSSVTGATVHYRPGGSGSFRISASSTDSGSGIAAYHFPTLGSGWTRTQSGATATYTWTGTPAAPGSQPVRAQNHAGSDSANRAFTAIPDSTAPDGGYVRIRDGFTTASRITVELGRGTDSQSGIATRRLERADAPLLNDLTCDAFGSYALVLHGLNPPEPRLDPVEPGFCYRYRYLVTDRVGNSVTYTSEAVAKVLRSDYAKLVRGAEGLSSYWRLGEPTMVYDSFTPTGATPFANRTPDVGATWKRHDLIPVEGATVTTAGRVRRTIPANEAQGAVYYSSIPQDQTDYTVEADLHYVSAWPNDAAALTARLDGDSATGYAGGYNQATGTWQVLSVVQSGSSISKTVMNESAPEPLTPGTTYHLALDMHGDRIRLLVDGVLKASAIDKQITIGTGGFLLGFGDGSSSAPPESAGMQLDNFRITPSARDTAGGPGGFYLGAPALGTAGAVTGDENTAAAFDGFNDEVRLTARLDDALSVELWFNAGAGREGALTWRDAAPLFTTDGPDPDVPGDDLGIGLAADGSVVAGVGEATLRSGAGLTDHGWHHVVLTRLSGTLRLYVDGTEVDSGAVPAATAAPEAAVRLGRAPGVVFAGLLDEVAVYTEALTPELVMAHRTVAVGTTATD